jgi:type IV pilus assembly protein PilM
VFKPGDDSADIATVKVPNLRARLGEIAPKNKTARQKSVRIGLKSVRIGLDIGSSAVRAAEVAVGQSGTQVRRFAQVGLPPGAVVEGEVRDEAAVAEAIRRLWAEGGFKQKDVVLGISSQRAMVRQLDMPEMGEIELRSALRYEIGELLPIPVEDAVFDFAILGPGKPKGDGGRTTQVLVVVAQRDIVWEAINVARRAGLRVRAVDSSPLALLRAVPCQDGHDLECVVSIGAHLVVVAVREDDTPRFLRTVSISATSSPTTELAQIGALAGSSERTASTTGGNLAGKRDYIAEEVRSSLEYFFSHGQGAQLSSIELTGGGALIQGVGERIAAAVRVPVTTASVVAGYSPAALDLSEAQVEEASARWTTAIGLALWGAHGVHAPSLLPPEIKERAQRQRAIAGAGAGIAVLCVLLGALSETKASSTATVQKQISANSVASATLEAQIAKLESVTQVQQDIISRRGLGQEALSDDIDWVALDSRLVAALPAGVQLTGLTFTEDTPTTSSPGAPAPAKGANYIGSVTISAQTDAGPPSVGQFVDRVANVKGLAGLWVASATSTDGTAGGPGSRSDLTFQATAEVTPQALSDRGDLLPGGKS